MPFCRYRLRRNLSNRLRGGLKSGLVGGLGSDLSSSRWRSLSYLFFLL